MLKSIKMFYNGRVIDNTFLNNSNFSYKLYGKSGIIDKNVYHVENDDDRNTFFQYAKLLKDKVYKGNEVFFNLVSIDDKNKIKYTELTELEKIKSKLKILQQ